MPELPEVEHATRGLGAQIIGRRIVVVTHLDWERMVETPSPAEFRALLVGRTVLDAYRRAKWILLTLDEGWTLALHLRMSGVVSVQGPQAQPDRHTHLVLQLDDGRQVFFNDTRKFGRARLLDAEGLAALDTAHGIEPLSEAFTPERLGELLRSRRSQIKPLLLDQKLIAGIGNIYADEALWRARLHWARPTETLTRPKIGELVAAVREVMAAALDQGGTSFDHLYVNVNGESGYFDRYLAVYGRRDEPCPRCGTPIRRDAFMNRSSYSCPKCQPRPRNARP